MKRISSATRAPSATLAALTGTLSDGIAMLAPRIARLAAIVATLLVVRSAAADDKVPPVAPGSLSSDPAVEPARPTNVGPAVTPAPMPIPTWRAVLNNLTVFRWNPLGIENQTRFGVQRKLYSSNKALFRDNFIHVGIYPRLNPAFAKIGPSIEIQALSIFNLRLAAEYVGMFGTFGYLQSFQSPMGNYADSNISALRRDSTADGTVNDRTPYATNGLHMVIEPTVQMKFGPIAIRNKLSAEYYNMSIRDGDRVFYDVTLDTLVPQTGWVIANDLDVAFVSKYRFTVGARYTVVKPLYTDQNFQSAAEKKAFEEGTVLDPVSGTMQLDANGKPQQNYANTHHRLGLVLAYTFFEREYTRFNKPTLILITSWYLQSRYRTGLDVSQATPYVILGFSFQSDFLK